jgi:hypothetical protein
MAKPVDDLKVGHWYAIEDVHEDDDVSGYGVEFYLRPPRRRREKVATGQPLQLLAISLPFIVVTDGNQRFSLDTRRCQLCELDRRYVSALTIAEMDGNRQPVFLDEAKRKKENPDPRLCPNCREGRLIQTYRARDYWCWVCPVCGFEGRPPAGNLVK